MKIEMLYALDAVNSLSVFAAMCEGQLKQQSVINSCSLSTYDKELSNLQPSFQTL